MFLKIFKDWRYRRRCKAWSKEKAEKEARAARLGVCPWCEEKLERCECSRAGDGGGE